MTEVILNSSPKGKVGAITTAVQENCKFICLACDLMTGMQCLMVGVIKKMLYYGVGY
jgi:hypothetical protein